LDVPVTKFTEIEPIIKIEDSKNQSSQKKKSFKLEASLNDSIQVGKSYIYDFDIWEFTEQTILAIVNENRYLIYLMNMETEKLTLLKEEEITLVEEVS
jgi:hypothetical protein